MKVDPVAVQIAAGLLVPVTVGLFCIRKRLLQLFAVLLLGFLVLELALPFLGFGRALWWAIHMPSAIILGADEILERHGVLISTVLHLADLVLWSAIISIPMAIKLKKDKKTKVEATAS